MSADDLLGALVFIALMAVLLTSPTWGEWIEGKAADFERVAADQHFAILKGRSCD